MSYDFPEADYFHDEWDEDYYYYEYDEFGDESYDDYYNYDEEVETDFEEDLTVD